MIRVVDRHAVQLVGQGHTRLHLERQPRGLLPHRCRSVSAVEIRPMVEDYSQFESQFEQ